MSEQASKDVLKRALVEIRDLRARLDESERARHEPVAIVGIGCRFPGGANTPDAFWQLLIDGVDAVSALPAGRWSEESDDVTHGGFIDDVDRFDADFFGMAPREAKLTDPQQRLLLEVAWEALENASIAATTLSGTRTGVFVGISTSDYSHLQLRGRGLESIDAYFSTGTNLAVAAGRLSYVLGLRGPSLSVDTACSSSLSAVHLAVRSLRSGESDLALAGGVGLLLSPVLSVNFAKARMLSKAGMCKTFDAAADGYVRGEGCGVVVLKRLRDAEAANDRIIAVIRGTAMNNDGRSAGLTAPNGPSQTSVIRDALADAHLAPQDVACVEAHGTGTPLGDPIELRALTDAYGAERNAPLVVGSLKTNIGHLEAAAGIAGLIKAALMVERGAIPRHLHFTTPNPALPWNEMPIAVPTATTAWPDAAQRIAAVSAFGFSGTNVHTIVEGAPSSAEGHAVHDDRPLHVLTISARTPAALDEARLRMQRALTDASLADVAFTANTGRVHFGERIAVIARDAADAARSLDDPAAFLRGSVDEARDRPRIAFLSFDDELAARWQRWGIEPDAIVRDEGELRKALDDGCELSLDFGSALDPGKPCVPAGGDWQQLLTSLATLYVHGAEIDWSGFDRDYARRKVALPTYPFQRERHWLDDGAPAESRRTILTPSDDGRFGHRGMLHAGAYFDLLTTGGSIDVEEISFRAPLLVERQCEIETLIERDGSFRIRSESVVHASGRLRRAAPVATSTSIDVVGRVVDADELYASLAGRGFDIVDDARGLKDIVTNGRQAMARVDADTALAIELCAQLFFVFAGEGDAFVLGECREAHYRPGRAARVSVSLEALAADGLTGRFQVVGSDGSLLAAGHARLARTEGRTLRRLTIAQPGAIDSIGMIAAPRRSPGRGEIEIEVRAAGLDFGDVLAALELSRGTFAPGADCAGIVTGVGSGVHSFRVGDEVIALARGALASSVIAEEAFVAPKPRGISFAEAATLPACFLTAALALRAANLRSGERLLIHSAAGGVGLAAIQLARRAGAEIIATAGTPEKRDFLFSLGLTNVYDSRSPSFGRDLAGTIDVAIGAVTGEIFDATIAALGSGRLVDLGKRYDAAPNLIPFDLYGVDRAIVSATLRSIVNDVEAGALRPLPLQMFSIAEAAGAFRRMSLAQHIGKLVIDFADRAPSQRPVMDIVVEHAGAVLERDGATIPIRKPLADLGLDSLMAIELRDRLSRDLGRDLPATLLFRHPTIESLVEHLGEPLPRPVLSSENATEDATDETILRLDRLLDEIEARSANMAEEERHTSMYNQASFPRQKLN